MADWSRLRLVLGVGRSGTTWLAYVLGQTTTPIRFFMEGLADGYHPFLADVIPLDLARYAERDDPDWQLCLIKEVHSLWMTEPMLKKGCKAVLVVRDPVRVVDSLLTRDGLNGLYLCKEVGLPLHGSRQKVISDMIDAVGVINATLRELARGFNNAMLVEYENMCKSPVSEFKAAATFLDLEWSGKCEQLLNDTMTGQHREDIRFSIFRHTERQLDKPWTFLTTDEVGSVSGTG